MAKTRQALGRGLSALIPTTPDLQAAAGPATVTPTERDVGRLQPNSDQPRTTMDETRLDELSRSIEVSGVIQPIVVRRLDDDRFEIVAGERRWRAAQRAGLHRVPVVVRDVADENLLQLALVENLQRENLNPIEEAEGYRQLIAEHGLPQDAVAQAVGKDRAPVANYVRLLQLPSEVQAELGAGRMAMGHARALLGLAAGAPRLLCAEPGLLSRRLCAGELGLGSGSGECARAPLGSGEPRAAGPSDGGRAAARCPHPRGTGPPPGCAGYARPHRPPGEAGAD